MIINAKNLAQKSFRQNFLFHVFNFNPSFIIYYPYHRIIEKINNTFSNRLFGIVNCSSRFLSGGVFLNG